MNALVIYILSGSLLLTMLGLLFAVRNLRKGVEVLQDWQLSVMDNVARNAKDIARLEYGDD